MTSLHHSASAISPHADGGSIAALKGRPCSNTGRKVQRTFRQPLPRLSSDGQALSGALVDWLAFTVFPDSVESEWMQQDPSAYIRHLSAVVFGNSNFVVSDVEQRGRNGYTHTAKISVAGVPCGFFALGGNRGSVNLQLSGTGCAQVACWFNVAAQLQRLEARITRVDLAFDDYQGRYIDLARWEHMARAGDVRAGNGPRPAWRVYEGSESKSLYVGRKGSKELCVYEKGKEQGDKESSWLRAEVRIWAVDRIIPYAVLTQTLSYLRAAYNVLAELPGSVCERIRTVRKSVQAKASAAVSWLRHAAGPLIDTLTKALGPEQVAFILFNDVRRSAVPRRFVGIPRDQLDRHLQDALCPCPF